MPRHRVINRRNAVPLVRRSISVTPEAIDQANELAETLGVSLGSIIDTALRDLLTREPAEVIDALSRHDHLTDPERRLVEDRLRSRETP